MNASFWQGLCVCVQYVWVCVCIIYPIDKHVLFFSNRLLEGLPTHRKLPLQRTGSSVTKIPCTDEARTSMSDLVLFWHCLPVKRWYLLGATASISSQVNASWENIYYRLIPCGNGGLDWKEESIFEWTSSIYGVSEARPVKRWTWEWLES